MLQPSCRWLPSAWIPVRTVSLGGFWGVRWARCALFGTLHVGSWELWLYPPKTWKGKELQSEFNQFLKYRLEHGSHQGIQLVNLPFSMGFEWREATVDWECTMKLRSSSVDKGAKSTKIWKLISGPFHLNPAITIPWFGESGAELCNYPSTD